MGGQHAVLVTRNGKLYEWGAGVGGHQRAGAEATSPERVPTLWSRRCAPGSSPFVPWPAPAQQEFLLHNRLQTGRKRQTTHDAVLAMTDTLATTRLVLAVMEQQFFTGARRVRSVACSDRMTAAITSDGALFTWGDGTPGNLGYAQPARQFVPRQVGGGLAGQHVTQVLLWSAAISCTPPCAQR